MDTKLDVAFLRSTLRYCFSKLDNDFLRLDRIDLIAYDLHKQNVFSVRLK